MSEVRSVERNRAYQKKQRDKKKASQPEKPRKRTLEELAKLDRAGADLTPEETERLAAFKQRKAEAVKRCREKKKCRTAPQAAAENIERTCRMFRSGLVHYPGKSGTAGGPLQSEKGGLAGFESPR